MIDTRLTAAESRLGDIIWENEPVGSGELVKLASAALGWKKSTTYTILKRITDKGIFINDGGTVRSLISKEELFSMQSEIFVEETFHGSLPAFLAAFTKRKPLTDEEIEELKDIIDSMRK